MLWLILSVFIIAADQITKHFIIQNISEGQIIPVIGHFFELTYYRNSGAAWSLLLNGRTIFLTVIPVISAVLLYYMIKNKSSFLRFSLAMILGGAVGNYIDRIHPGTVTDFLMFNFGTYTFPIFNVADMAIVCGTILMAIYILFIYKEPPKKEPGDVKDAQ